MPNPVQKVEELIRLLEHVKVAIPMAVKWKESIANNIELLNDMYQRLKYIDESVVPLNLEDKPQDESRYLEIWNNLASGVYKADSGEFKRLYENSNTLKALYTAGIDIPEFVKFSKDEISLATEIGPQFEGIYDLLDNIKGAIRFGSGDWKTTRQYVDVDNNFFGLLKKYKIVEYEVREAAFEEKDGKKNVDYLVSTPQKIKRLPPRHPIKFKFRFLDSSYNTFLMGNWFNAYAYAIIENHLKRNNFTYELCSMVSYKAPSDIIRSNGDFDILAMVGEKILLVECKSGELREERGREDFSKIIDKAEGIKKVFDSTRSDYYDYNFLLIYSPFSNEPGFVSSQLQGTGIAALRPDEIRGKIVDLFRKTE